MANDEVKVETICGAPMPDRLWLVDMGCGDVSWTAEREPDGEAPLEAVEYVRLAARSASTGDAAERVAKAIASNRIQFGTDDAVGRVMLENCWRDYVADAEAALAAMQPRND